MSSPISKLRASLNDLSISRKIVGVTLLSSLVTLVLLLALTFFNDWNAFVENKVSGLETLARILESNTVASLRFNDPHTAKQYVDSFQSETDIASVSIYTKDNVLFARFSRDGSEPLSPETLDLGAQWQGSRLLYSSNVISDSQIVGKILIVMDANSFKAAFWERLWISIALLLSGLAVTGALAWRLQRFIAKPIRELVEVSRTIADQRDYKLRVHKRSNDEIGSLVESFNAMLEAIRLRDETLLATNSNLEQTIEERTQDLNNRNEALKKAIEAANAANEAKSEFLATTSHELRTPLNPIIGYVDKLLFKERSLEDTRELEIIKQSAELLLRLIDDILDFSLIERGDIRLDKNDIDLQKFCRDALYLMRPLAEAKGLELKYEHKFEGDSPFDARPVVVTDEGRLKQILLNFVGNAIKFTHEGSITVNSKIEIGDDQRDSLLIEVNDTGIGIKDKDLKKLFKPFSQVDGSLSRQYSGMGLGLAISRKFAEVMGGSIGCSSEAGAGSRFWIRIPVSLKKVAFEDVEAVAAKATLPKSGHGKVLLVEDELVNRELGAVLLRSIGYEVVCARDGFDALDIVERQDFDIILLDLRMPGMDGYMTATKLRLKEKPGRRTPIVAVSAHVTPKDKERCLEVGMDGSLQKPLTLQKLADTLDKWLGEKS